ncbi:MAG: LysM peptidoglycan-binding domain-containing protein [Lachnospiraceae bacterium]|nr:LysM peptidoglycan-binding domain-containing protein [Lachnospiraceae bacterium]MCD8250421.1 LysM peptidoglycan-binding domain-containing protein [Lachnospiraceae bacterium]
MYAAKTEDREYVRKCRRNRAIQQQKQERRRVIILLVVTLILIFAFGVGFGTLLTRAQEPTSQESYKYYTSIEIEKGDTLWSIADEYMDSVHYADKSDFISEVMTLNHMGSSSIVSGQKLIVPYYSSELK